MRRFPVNQGIFQILQDDYLDDDDNDVLMLAQMSNRSNKNGLFSDRLINNHLDNIERGNDMVIIDKDDMPKEDTKLDVFEQEEDDEKEYPNIPEPTISNVWEK